MSSHTNFHFSTFEQFQGDGEFLSSIRAVRVLRPLRAINRIPSEYSPGILVTVLSYTFEAVLIPQSIISIRSKKIDH